MLAIFNRFVTRRVSALAHNVSNLAPRLLMPSLPSPVQPSELPDDADELDIVRWSFDTMEKQLEADIEALKNYTDRLQDTVQERTADLEREKKNLAQALGELQKILEHASLGIGLVVPEQAQRRIILRANLALEQILGYGPGELNGVDVRLLFRSDEEYDRISSAYDLALPEGRCFRGEIAYLRKDGRHVLVEAVGAAVDPADLSKGTIWLLNDITSRKSAERALAAAKEDAESGLIELSKAHSELNDTLAKLRTTQAELVEREKMAALGSLVAGVSHELNTPIGNSLMGATTLCDSALSLRDQLRQGLKKSTLETYLELAIGTSELVIRNLHRAAELVQSFKQIAVDQTSSQRRRFNLNTMISEFIEMLRPSIRNTRHVVEHIIPDDIEMDSYPGPLGQIVSNLITNAFIHGFDGQAEGTVRIEARLLNEHWVELTVSDNGTGIPKENLVHIFEPFFTTKLGQGGSGLGLNIVHNIVTGMMGGRISVTSAPGHRTTFCLHLPIVAPVEAGPAQVA